MNEQQKYIEVLRRVTTPEIKVALDCYKPKTKKYEPGFRHNIDMYKLHDERTACINEVIFDFDYSSYVKNFKQAQNVVETLKMRGIEPYVCATGGKGIHIHIFFDKITCKLDENKELLKEAFSYGLTWKHIRLWIWNSILDEAGIEKDHRGMGKQLDSFPMNFDYFAGSTRLIRDIGGRKHVKNSDGEWTKYYKTYIPLDEFTKKKPIITNIDQVRFPTEIKLFKIGEHELSGYLENFIKEAKVNEFREFKNEKLPVNYRDLDGVARIREGLGTGQRSLGALTLSIACKVDGLKIEEATVILKEYVENCGQTQHKFSDGEALQWLDWVYTQNNVFWSCAQLKSLGLHNEYDCEYCKFRHKDALKFLTATDMLKKIEEVLDFEIVGEMESKALIFLLLLSKDFPSHTGKPDWNIISDPQSQNVILSADSSSGKTYLVKAILKLFGEKDVDYFVISRITKNAINYFTDVNMDGKIIFIEEMQGLDDATSQLRLWMSEGCLTLNTVEKVKNDEGVEVNTMVTKTTTGQPSFITCQAEGLVNDQLNNRSWVLSTDVSDEQTKMILNFQNDMNQGLVKINKKKIRMISDAMKQLRPYHFKIPYADHNAMEIPINDIRVRRDYQKFLTLIKCSAYLHQKQRQIVKENEQEFIICTIQDYDIARLYSSGILGATFSGLTMIQLNLLTFLKKSTFNMEFEIRDLQRNLNKSQPYWYGQLKQLVDLGYISCEKNMGKATVYSLVKEKTVNLIKLPTGEELAKKLLTSS